MAQKVFLSLGSNIGEREEHLRRAIELMADGIEVTCISSLWSTRPVGITSQPDFLNIAVATRTQLEPHPLLSRLKDIEREVGRRLTYRWGPRVIDIDIILYDRLVLDLPDLSIPHREMAHRAFVLAPLDEISPHTIDPRSSLTIHDLLARSPDIADVTRLGPLSLNRT